jgi:hypothetical protein
VEYIVSEIVALAHCSSHFVGDRQTDVPFEINEKVHEVILEGFGFLSDLLSHNLSPNRDFLTR